MLFILQDGFTQIEEYVIMTFDNCIVIDQLNMIGIHAVELVKARETLTDTLACMLIKLVNHKLQQLPISHHLVFFLFLN